MKFTKTTSDIEREYGRPFVEVYHELEEKGMSQTEIVRYLEIKSASYITHALREEKLKQTIKPLFPKLKYENIRQMEVDIEKITGRTYKELLYHLYIEQSYSGHEIAHLLNVPPSTMNYHIKTYGISKTLKQAREDVIKKGKINFTTMNQTARKTKSKGNGSNKQEIIRDLIKYHIESKLTQYDCDYLEIIVGYNDWGILKSSEVDIPIITINNANNTYKKYSVEYNGEFWHQDVERDNIKKKKLLESDWNHFIIYDETSLYNIEKLYIDPLAQQIVSENLLQ